MEKPVHRLLNTNIIAHHEMTDTMGNDIDRPTKVMICPNFR